MLPSFVRRLLFSETHARAAARSSCRHWSSAFAAAFGNGILLRAPGLQGSTSLHVSTSLLEEQCLRGSCPGLLSKGRADNNLSA